MILVPLPRFVLPTQSPLFWLVQKCRPRRPQTDRCPSTLQILRQGAQNRCGRSVVDPYLEPTVAGLVLRISYGKILPRSPSPQYPQDPMEYLPGVPSGTPSAIAAARGSGISGATVAHCSSVRSMALMIHTDGMPVQHLITPLSGTSRSVRHLFMRLPLLSRRGEVESLFESSCDQCQLGKPLWNIEFPWLRVSSKPG